MHHPGPPRFAAVGDEIQLAPRDPDPATAYRWSVERAPPAATATVGDDPVESFRPDAPGRYVLALDAPDGRHRLTVRCFPGPPRSERRPDGISERRSGGGLLGAPGEGQAAYEPPGSDGDRGEGRPRVRLDGRVADGAVVVEADPRPHPESAATPAALDVEFVLDDRDALGAADAAVDGRRLRVPLDRLPERARIHAVAVGDRGHSVPDAVEVRRRDGGIEVRRPHQPPAWATDAAYYEVYVRTFAPGAGHGETLAAIADRLDHLSSLGVDVLWLTPILEHDGAPHGYNITDFFSVAADLGDRADARRLVERAHDRDMRVLFDLVLNHSARDHPHFRDAYRNPDSEYREWYEWRDSGEPGTYFGWEHIANFDFSSLAVRRHLLDAIDTWAPLVDGFRCDMAWAVPESFWLEVRDRVKEDDPEFLLLDETIPYVPDFHRLFDVHFDSTTYASLRSVGTGWAPAEALLDAVEERAAVGFPDHAEFLLYAENHDEARYLAECGRPAALAAAGALCTLPGAPLVYAGQEFGQRGRRDELVWPAADEALTEHYRRLLDLRTSMPALAADAGLRQVEYAVREGDPDRVVAFGRAAPGDEDDAVVVCHFAEGAATVRLDPAVDTVDAATGADVGTDGGVRVEDIVVLPAAPGEPHPSR